MNRSIENLAALWSSIDALCDGLGEDEWKRPTGCPGWTVQDQVAHLIDYESGALGRPRPEHVVPDDGADHLKNDIGKANEVGIDYRRSWPGAKVLAEFREVTADRLAQLQALTDDDLAQEVMTPAGPGTVADMLTLRVMDTWSHEQDVRRALGRPGHVAGPAVDEAIGYFLRFVPLAVAKRAKAPEGSTVLLHIGDRPPLAIAVVDGRGVTTDELPQSPTVALRMPVATFAALVGGRADRPDDIEVVGDSELGDRIVGALGFMP